MMSQANISLAAFSNDLAQAVAQTASAIVAVHARYRLSSSGVIWREGVVVTAAHTVRREEDIEITLPDGSRGAAELAGLDAGTDLAVLKAPAAKATVLERSEAGALRVGQLAIAIARLGEHGVSASLGVIGGLSGAWRTWRGGHVEQLIRVAITLYPGFSGGALLDAQGSLIGINTAGLARSGAIALPPTTVDRVADALLARGYIARPYLGVALQSARLSDPIRRKLNLGGGEGVVVLSVEPGGPAERAGVLVGDVLWSLNGESVADPTDVQHALGAEPIDRTMAATIVRGGELVTLQVTPGERPRRSR